MKRWFSSFIGMILVCAITIAQTSISLLPKPQLYKDTGKNFTMGKVKLSTPVLRPEWEVFIMNAGGEIVEHSSSVIEVELVPSIEEARLNGAEAYRLSVSNKRIKIEAVTEQGVYWAMQTLRQLEQKKGKRSSVAGCEIVDWPAFRIRGFMQDVKREFVLDCAKHVDVGLSDAELTEELDESNFIDGYHLDVDKLLYGEILSDWPVKVLCREDCKGLCKVCGQNLNTKSCDCEDTGLDPRMSVVRDLFKNFKEV